MMQQSLESDFEPITTDTNPRQFLPGTKIEVIRPLHLSAAAEHVLFDFDGTLSLIREGWVEVMVPMMVEELRKTPTDESPEELARVARNFVLELTGKQTIYQMLRLAEEIATRGGTPAEPLEYKHEYHRRLMERIASRREDLRRGKVAPAEMVVPGSFELLDTLRARGLSLYLASGTDEAFVYEEAELLGLDAYFGKHIYGAIDDYRSFSKALVIERILTTAKVPGEKLVGFGDGYVEIQNIKQVWGTAVGVASDEADRSGRPDPWKRDRLIAVGADLIIPDFREQAQLVQYLWDRTS
jgi:phosphoglycolate phosphatase-like HAD superfamily hydrolase